MGHATCLNGRPSTLRGAVLLGVASMAYRRSWEYCKWSNSQLQGRSASLWMRSLKNFSSYARFGISWCQTIWHNYDQGGEPEIHEIGKQLHHQQKLWTDAKNVSSGTPYKNRRKWSLSTSTQISINSMRTFSSSPWIQGCFRCTSLHWWTWGDLFLLYQRRIWKTYKK